MSSLDHARMSSDFFADRLRYFVAKWAPRRELADRDAFQHDLMRLFVDAMRHQTTVMGAGIEHYASEAFQQRSIAPLTVIMEAPKSKDGA
jgi:hypothetical protein